MRTLERLHEARAPARVPEARTPVLEWHDRVDLLLHALAQLPDSVTLELEAPPPELQRLRLIAAAYAIDDRVTFIVAPGRQCRGAFLTPSSVHGQRAVAASSTLGEVVEALSTPEEAEASLRAHDLPFAGHRIAIVTNLATHYRVPLFNEMALRLRAAGASFRVLLLADIPQGRSWMRVSSLEFEHEILDSRDVSADRGRRLIPRNLESRLSAYKPTIILSSGFSPAVSGRAARFAHQRRIPFGIWSGEIASRRTAQSRLRRIQRTRLLRQTSFAVAYGSESAHYLSSLDPGLPIVVGRNTAPSRQKTEELQGPGPIELLTVGRAQKGKALDSLVDAVLGLEEPYRLTIVGAGPELTRLKRMAMGCDKIRFAGALPFAEVIECYRRADVFAFPSQYDVFGLALVEAMGAGLCVLVSRAVGAAADLAVNRHNCLVLDGPDPQLWRNALTEVANDADLRRSLGQNARTTIQRRWTITHAADAMIAGLRLGALQEASGAEK